MSDDTIKRSDAIGACAYETLECYEARKAIRALPSADRPQGKWIWDKDGMDWNIGAWVCSECHARNANLPDYKKIVPLRWSGSKFCPNCGADMRKGKDDE